MNSFLGNPVPNNERDAALAVTIADKSIALHSSNGGLQTGLLAKLISDELGLHCEVYRELSAIPKQTDLVLIDCNNQTIDNLSAIAKELNTNFTNSNAALLNAEYESEQENLLDWPCISGLFYGDTQQDPLLRGLERLLEGDYWVPRRLLHHFLDRNRKAPIEVQHPEIQLTKRERQILKLINDGATNAHISKELSVSEHTVKSHLYNVYKKIGVKNRLEASNWVRNVTDIDSL